MLIRAGAENPSLEVPAVVVYAALLLSALLRTGLLGLVVCIFLSWILGDPPLTLDSSRWYASHGWFYVAVALAIAVWGFRTSLGGKPLFGGASLDE